MFARRSDDKSTQNAAVLYDKSGVSIGYGVNNIPDGVDEIAERYERPEKYFYTEHAERNALFCCARFGKATTESTMYALWAACADCARAIIECGVSTLVTHDFYRSTRWGDSIAAGYTMLNEAGIEVVKYSGPVDPDGPGLLFNGEIVRF